LFFYDNYSTNVILNFYFQLVCVIVANEADVAAFKNFVPTAADDSPVSTTKKPTAPAPPPPPAAPTSAPAPKAPTPAATPPPPPPPTPAPMAAMAAGGGSRVFATPYARTLAAEKGIDLRVSLKKYSLHLSYTGEIYSLRLLSSHMKRLSVRMFSQIIISAFSVESIMRNFIWLCSYLFYPEMV
jgi:hypothetical protein